MRDIFSVQNEMNRILDNIWGDRGGDDGSMLVPAVDLVEKDDKFSVSIELPGLKREDVKVTLQENTLTISGTKNRESETRGDRYHRIERSFGSFCRTVNLPTGVDLSGIKADFKDGILTVQLSKVEEAKPKEIAIKG
jgi:HSP20 family protein